MYELLVSDKELSETIEPGMRCLNNPSPCFKIWVGFLFFNFFPALLYVRDVIMFFDNLLSRLTGIALIRAKVLRKVIGTVDHYFIKHNLKLGNIMTVCPCYDYRQRDTTAVHQDVPLAAFFSPCPLGSGPQLPGRGGL